jgi:hypothetical protein
LVNILTFWSILGFLQSDQASHKIALRSRLKKRAARWNVESGQAVLTLAAKARSGLWLSDVVKPLYSKHGESFHGVQGINF